MALYHFPLPFIEVRSIDFVSNRSIAVDYLGVGAGRTEETAVAMGVVMALVRAARNSVSIASGIAGAGTLSLLSAFTAALSGAFLFARPAIVQSS